MLIAKFIDPEDLHYIITLFPTSNLLQQAIREDDFAGIFRVVHECLICAQTAALYSLDANDVAEDEPKAVNEFIKEAEICLEKIMSATKPAIEKFEKTPVLSNDTIEKFAELAFKLGNNFSNDIRVLKFLITENSWKATIRHLNLIKQNEMERNNDQVLINLVEEVASSLWKDISKYNKENAGKLGDRRYLIRDIEEFSR